MRYANGDPGSLGGRESTLVEYVDSGLREATCMWIKGRELVQ